MTRIHDFQKELFALLNKYQADVEWICDDCSDLHGVVGERMRITCDGETVDFPGSFISPGEENDGKYESRADKLRKRLNRQKSLYEKVPEYRKPLLMKQIESLEKQLLLEEQ